MSARAAALAVLALCGGCVEDVELLPDAGGRDLGATDADFADLGTDAPTSPTDAGPDAPAHCGLPSATCAASAECCSGLCVGAACSIGTCREAATSCQVASDCCSGTCSGGTCVGATGCSPVGEPCGASSDCCSRACAADGTGRVVCQSLGGCSPAGELCRAADDCCSHACAGIDATSGIGRCSAAGGACLGSGEICSVGGASLGTCCGGAGGHVTCTGSGVDGIARCVADTMHIGCFATGAACDAPSECCSARCVPNAGGVLVCATSCSAAGGACTRHADCCAGVCTGAGTCAGDVSTCAALGAACDVDATCCSGSCSASTHTCATPLV